jgi:hypothetical protein
MSILLTQCTTTASQYPPIGVDLYPTGVTVKVSASWVRERFKTVLADKIVQEGQAFLPEAVWVALQLPSITNAGVEANVFDFVETKIVI